MFRSCMASWVFAAVACSIFATLAQAGESNSLRGSAKAAVDEWKALFVIGTPVDQPLYADKIYRTHLEKHGYTVVLVQDKDVTEVDCMASQIMLISATISGGAVGTRLNNCSTPQMIWESRLFSLNGMAAEVEEAQRVTSEFFHKYHEAGWTSPDLVPPAPTGAMVQVVRNGVSVLERFWTVEDYGMNYISKSKLGNGATILAILPPEKTASFTEPEEEKATLFYYGKGDALFANFGVSPAFRLAWPAFCNADGKTPSCQDLAGVDCPECMAHCQNASTIIASGEDPMPLSTNGIGALDWAIARLTAEAKKEQQLAADKVNMPLDWTGGKEAPEATDGGARLLQAATEPGSEGDYAPAQLLTLAGAKHAMAAAEAAADAQGYKVSIAICDAAGITTLLVRNADGHSGEEAMMKCKTAALFQVETSSLETAVNVTQGRARTALLSTPWLMMTGGLPMFKDGGLVGAIGVSGVSGPLGVPIGRAAVSAIGASTQKA